MNKNIQPTFVDGANESFIGRVIEMYFTYGLAFVSANLVGILLGLGLSGNNLVGRLWVVALEGDSLVGRLWGLALIGEHCGVCKHTKQWCL